MHSRIICISKDPQARPPSDRKIPNWFFDKGYADYVVEQEPMEYIEDFTWFIKSYHGITFNSTKRAFEFNPDVMFRTVGSGIYGTMFIYLIDSEELMSLLTFANVMEQQKKLYYNEDCCYYAISSMDYHC